MEEKYLIAETKTIYKVKVPVKDRVKITSSRDIYRFLKPFFAEYIDHQEAFFAIMLNRANHILSIQLISVGGVAGTVVDVKMVLKPCINLLASGVIVAHNHPSGTFLPSREDITFTKKLQDGAKLLDIALLDHLIITDESYYSMSDCGDL